MNFMQIQLTGVLLVCCGSLVLQLIILKRQKRMSLDPVQVQADLDAVTALANTVVPAAAQLIDALVAEVVLLKSGQPGQLDMTKVEADVTALKAQISGLGTKVDATAVDPPPAAPGA